MNKSSKNKQSTRNYCSGQKLSLARRLGEVWQDLQDGSQWKYEQLSPIQLLEKWGLRRCAAHNDELARANWFWNRRPSLLHATSCIAWFIVTLGLPLWLFVFPAIGVPLLIAAAVTINTEIVRSARWRRQYELSIDRLIRTSTNNRDTFGLDVFS